MTIKEHEELQLTEVQNQLLELSVGLDEEKYFNLAALFQTYYPILKHIRGWLMSNLENPDESKKVLNRFNGVFKPVQDALTSCTPTQRNVLEMKFGEEKSDTEISHQLHIEQPEVQSSLFQTFKKLTEHSALQKFIGKE